MIRKGQPWGRPATAPADFEVTGDDAALAAAVAGTPGARIRFRPTGASELARAVGLEPAATETGAPDPGATNSEASPAPEGMTELPMDVLAFADGTLAVNMVVLGTSPERLGRFARRTELRIRADNRVWFNDECTTVVLAVGQWLHGIDLVPRGHPGDGRVEIQAYRLRPSERRAMRRRLASGAHLPHPRIPTRTAHRIEIEAAAPVPLEVDGLAREPVRRLTAEVRADAYRLLV
jgi:hypothetical protein